VVNHEPHLALFVPDNDPLIFYRAIAAQSKTMLKTAGLLIVEINERLGNEVQEIFLQNGFTSIQIVKDIAGKNRMVRGQKAT
jgi:release factor glutamine methyltransferase